MLSHLKIGKSTNKKHKYQMKIECKNKEMGNAKMHKTKTQILNLTTNTSNDTNTKLEIDNAEIQKFTKQTQIQKQKPKAKKYTTNIKIQKTPILHSNRCRSCGTCTMQGTCRCRRSLSAVCSAGERRLCMT